MTSKESTRVNRSKSQIPHILLRNTRQYLLNTKWLFVIIMKNCVSNNSSLKYNNQSILHVFFYCCSLLTVVVIVVIVVDDVLPWRFVGWKVNFLLYVLMFLINQTFKKINLSVFTCRAIFMDTLIRLSPFEFVFLMFKQYEVKLCLLYMDIDENITLCSPFPLQKKKRLCEEQTCNFHMSSLLSLSKPVPRPHRSLTNCTLRICVYKWLVIAGVAWQIWQ